MNAPNAPTMASPAACPARERNTAVVALILALLAALVLCLLAYLTVMRPGDGAGGGNLVGVTPGSGGGQGTGTEGDGPGAGREGDGRGRDGAGDGPPAGVPDGPGAERTPEVLADGGPAADPPRFGFTQPDRPPEPVQPPATPAPSGVPDGDGREGRSGKGNSGTGTEFMGVRTEAKRVIYIIDQSGSMAGTRFAHTKVELRRSIEGMPASGAFLVIFFDTGALPMPPGKLVAATPRNKKDGIDWLREQTIGGGTDPTEALRIALQEPRPDAIFLMTDGQFAPEPVFAVINELNADRKVSINTICFHDRAAEPTLKQIAAENRGDYRYVPPPPEPTHR